MQLVAEHPVFRYGNHMVYTRVSLGYSNDLRIFTQSSVTAVRNRDEVLDAFVRIYSTEVGGAFVLMV